MEEEDCKIAWLLVQNDLKSHLSSPEQLKLALQMIGRNPSDRSVERYWSQCGGTMGYKRFCQVVQMEARTNMADLMKAFRKIDTNGDGFITAQELHKKLSKRGEKMSMGEVEAILAEVDRNNDGRLDYAEFCHMLLNTADDCMAVARQSFSRRTSASDQCHQTSPETTRQKRRSDSRKSRREEIKTKLHTGQDLSSRSSARERLLNRGRNSSEGGKTVLPLVSSFVTSQFQSPSETLPQGETVDARHSLPLATSISTDTSPVRVRRPLEKSADQGINGNIDSSLALEVAHVEPLPVNPLPARLPPLKKIPTGLSRERQESANVSQEKSVNAVSAEKTPGTSDGGEGDGGSANGLEERAKGKVEEKGSVNGETEGEAAGRESREARLEEGGADAGTSKGKIEVAEASEISRGDEHEGKDGGEPEGEKKESTAREEEVHSNVENELSHGDVDKREVDKKEPPSEEETGRRKEETPAAGNDSGAGAMAVVKEEPSHPGAGSNGGTSAAPPSCASTPPPKKPKNIESWHRVPGKGCFYLDQDLVQGAEHEDVVPIKCHHYQLTLLQPSNVWLEVGVAEPGISGMDVLLFVCRVDDKEEVTDVITYTQHRVAKKWVCRLDLEAGLYALLPYTSGCHLKLPDEDTVLTETTPLISRGEDGSVILAEEAKDVFRAIFRQVDLDSNGSISRTEFDFFSEVSGGEICDDETWAIIQANFAMTDEDEITESGFLGLQEMAAGDEEGGEAELWQCLTAMGYNKQLKLIQACPFELEVWCEETEGRLEIVDMQPLSPLLRYALGLWVVEGGVALPLQGVEEGSEEGPFVYLFEVSKLTTIVVENKSDKVACVQLDVSHSQNCLTNRDSSVHVLEVPAQERKIGYQLQPADVHAPYAVHCVASKILC